MRHFRPRRRRALFWLAISPLLFAAFAVLQVLILRVVPPFTSAFMLVSDAPEVRYDWVPWQKISAAAPLAMVAAEDQKFPEHWGFDFVDCQTRTDHLERFGSIPWPRAQFLDALAASLERPTRKGPWRFELSPAEALAKLSA